MFEKFRQRSQERRMERLILKEINKIRDEMIAHYNSMKPLKEHLEYIESEFLTRDINLQKSSNSLLRDNDNKNIDAKFYDELQKYKDEQIEKNDDISPIPRHDLAEFNKLVVSEDLEKRKIQHPNPKFQASEKFNFIFRNNLNFEENVIYDYEADSDDPSDSPDSL